jgi:sulfur carrier protein ThiS
MEKAPARTVDVIAKPDVCSSEFYRAPVPEGSTVAEIVGEAAVNQNLAVIVDGQKIERGAWPSTQLRYGQHVLWVQVPQDGDVWRVIAMVAVALVSAVAGAWVATSYGYFWGAAASSVVTISSSLEVNR